MSTQKNYMIYLILIKKLEKHDIDLLLADDSTKHALGRINDVMIELHMTFVPVDFIIMDMRSNTSSPIILGRPFLRTTGTIIDSKECLEASKHHLQKFGFLLLVR
jgi:hypothetical protein